MVGKVKKWECFHCGHVVYAKDYPMDIKWSDGHVCRFNEVVEKNKK